MYEGVRCICEHVPCDQVDALMSYTAMSGSDGHAETRGADPWHYHDHRVRKACLTWRSGLCPPIHAIGYCGYIWNSGHCFMYVHLSWVIVYLTWVTRECLK